MTEGGSDRVKQSMCQSRVERSQHTNVHGKCDFAGIGTRKELFTYHEGSAGHAQAKNAGNERSTTSAGKPWSWTR